MAGAPGLLAMPAFAGIAQPSPSAEICMISAPPASSTDSGLRIPSDVIGPSLSKLTHPRQVLDELRKVPGLDSPQWLGLIGRSSNSPPPGPPVQSSFYGSSVFSDSSAYTASVITVHGDHVGQTRAARSAASSVLAPATPATSAVAEEDLSEMTVPLRDGVLSAEPSPWALLAGDSLAVPQPPLAVAGSSSDAPVSLVSSSSEFFKKLSVGLHYSHHNWALKNFREQQVSAGLTTDLQLAPAQMDLKCVVHPKKGIDPEFAYEFHLDEHETFSWHWHSLVASLRDEDIDYVCGGPCSGGLVACSVSARKNSYDIKTHRADVLISQREKTTEKYKAKQEVWDFLLTRGDGSKVRLHPSHSNTKVTVAASEGHGEPVDVPGGLGGSDGRKCFKRVSNEGKLCELRFDAQKFRSTANNG
jgi:hypothetical protein